MNGERGKPVKLESKFYQSLEEAEWDVFQRRWKDFTGKDLELPTVD